MFFLSPADLSKSCWRTSLLAYRTHTPAGLARVNTVDSPITPGEFSGVPRFVCNLPAAIGSASRSFAARPDC